MNRYIFLPTTKRYNKKNVHIFGIIVLVMLHQSHNRYDYTVNTKVT